MCGHPTLDVKGNSEQDDAENKGDDDIVGGPTMRRVCAICDGKHNEHESRYNREPPPKVHLDLCLLPLWWPCRPGETEEGTEQAAQDDDGPEPKVPPPREQVPCHTADNDPQVEAQGGKGAVQTKDEVLARAGAVGLAEDHDAGGEEGSGAESLHGAGYDEHGVVLAEAGDEGPDEEPGQASVEDEVAAKEVGEAAKGQEEGAGDEGEDTGGPYLGDGGNLELACDGGEDDVETGDVKFLGG